MIFFDLEFNKDSVNRISIWSFQPKNLSHLINIHFLILVPGNKRSRVKRRFNYQVPDQIFLFMEWGGEAIETGSHMVK